MVVIFIHFHVMIIPRHGHRLLKKQEFESIYGIPKLSEEELKRIREAIEGLDFTLFLE